MRFHIICGSITCMLLLSSCAGKLEYTPPTETIKTVNSIIIDQKRSYLWDKLIPKLSKEYFVINNIDKDSGLINVSYSGNPLKYVDCGYIHSYVKNANGERNYRFAASSPSSSYEVLTDTLYFINRNMSLDGRVNIILEEIDSDKTQVTVNTRYVLTKKSTVTNVQGQSTNFNDTIYFNTAGQASFPNPGNIQQTLCIANGQLEKEILKLVK
ncbi:hypothetical protein [Thalassospira alkalitolerans]|uniref:hypothetical protein n=1 Tax=Thalassospira alkalitolerans TaxID=1293890 RepID=UPI000A1FCB24|nr:hypothetical protein [Thalassospira alkalitolerans]